VLLHQLGEGRVLALELGPAVGARLVPGVGVGLAALVGAGEGGLAVLEGEFLPGVEEGDADAVSFAGIGDRDLVEEVLAEQGDLLLSSEVTALPGHGGSSARVLPLTPAKANSYSDWGKTDGLCPGKRSPTCSIMGESIAIISRSSRTEIRRYNKPSPLDHKQGHLRRWSNQ
jgi:hypothetical protein